MFRRKKKRYWVHVRKSPTYWSSMTIFASSAEKAEQQALDRLATWSDKTYREDGYVALYAKPF